MVTKDDVCPGRKECVAQVLDSDALVEENVVRTLKPAFTRSVEAVRE